MSETRPHIDVGYQVGILTVTGRTDKRKSGYNGVYLNKRTGKWTAQITFKGKTYYLGSYNDIQAAVNARKRGEEMYDDFLDWYYSNDGEWGND